MRSCPYSLRVLRRGFSGDRAEEESGSLGSLMEVREGRLLFMIIGKAVMMGRMGQHINQVIIRVSAEYDLAIHDLALHMKGRTNISVCIKLAC